MTAAALKAEGNDYFGREEWERALECYSQALEFVEESDVVSKTALLSNRAACFVKLDQFDKALVDGNLCIKLRPNWSKGYARCAEAYSRQQNFRLSALAYSEAIRTSEDSTVKSRYAAARTVVKESQTKQEQTNFRSSAAIAFSRVYHRTWFDNFLEMKKKGYQEVRGGGLEVLLHAWNSAATGWKNLDDAVINDSLGKTGTSTNQDLSECILVDHEAFAIPQGGYRNPKYSFKDKFTLLIELEFSGLKIINYFAGRRWTASEIIADLAERKRKGEVWSTIRIIGAALTRGLVLMAFVKAKENKHAEAIEDLQLATELIDEGNKTWPNVPFTEKGSSFKATLRRLVTVQAMHYRLEANQMATNTSAKVAFSLKAIETAARTVLTENPQREWKSVLGADSQAIHWSRLAYHVLPTSRANVALGYCSAQRARVPLEPINLAASKLAVADTKHAKKAARFYDVAYKLLPDDYYGKPLVGYQALEQHFLAGGKTVKEVLELAEEIEKIRKALVPIFSELNNKDPARTFVEDRVENIRLYLESPQAKPLNGVEPTDLVLKPITTLDVGNNPETFDSTQYLTPAFWESLPGDVALVAKVQIVAYTMKPYNESSSSLTNPRCACV